MQAWQHHLPLSSFPWLMHSCQPQNIFLWVWTCPRYSSCVCFICVFTGWFFLSATHTPYTGHGWDLEDSCPWTWFVGTWFQPISMFHMGHPRQIKCTSSPPKGQQPSNHNSGGRIHILMLTWALFTPWWHKGGHELDTFQSSFHDVMCNNWHAIPPNKPLFDLFYPVNTVFWDDIRYIPKDENEFFHPSFTLTLRINYLLII